MRIGEAATQLDVATHVLRQWEDEGVVVPRRSVSGHREYDEEHLVRCRIVRSCQAAGLSLAEIRRVLHRGEPERHAVIDERLRAVRLQQAVLDATETFLVHVRECRHGLVTRCADCSAYAAPASPTQPSRVRTSARVE